MSTPTERVVRLDLPRAGSALSIVTISGCMFSSARAIPPILDNADAIIYMLSATSSHVPHLNPTVAEQQTYFDHYRRYAEQLRCLWTDKPWIWILNKVDRASEIPPLKDLPLSVTDQIIRCVASTGHGIDHVRTALKRLTA